MEPIKIVVRYSNGKVLKGFTNDFFPDKSLFHLRPLDNIAGGELVEVLIIDLKAVFFVKDFMGDSSYNEKKEFAEGQKPTGRKIEVTFLDGEVLVGTTTGYDPKRQGFFLFPADPQSNNLRTFIVSTYVSQVKYL